MSDFATPDSPETTPQPTATEATPALSQWARVSNTFSAPSRTFIDIRDKSRSWWLPILISTFFSYIFFALVTVKVGWQQVTENILAADPSTQEKLAQAGPAAQAQTMSMIKYSTMGTAWATPILILFVTLIFSLVLWGTINFVFGGKSKFSQIFAVNLYAGLPGIIKLVFGSIMLLIGTAPESFNLTNYAPTNLGYFLAQDSNKVFLTLATSLDFTTIWMVVLLSIGVATVAGVKRSSGYIAVFGWWAILVLFALGKAALHS